LSEPGSQNGFGWEAIAGARDFGWGAQRIADELGIGHGTVQRELERTGRNRMPRAVRRPVQRYEKSRPGELLHLDLKYLPALETRPEFEYAAIDDFSREGHALIARERSTIAATRFLEHVLAQLSYRVEAVMTDNDMMFTMRYAFYSNRLTRFEQALKSQHCAKFTCQRYRVCAAADRCRDRDG
jgi:hypothetical protein